MKFTVITKVNNITTTDIFDDISSALTKAHKDWWSCQYNGCNSYNVALVMPGYTIEHYVPMDAHK